MKSNKENIWLLLDSRNLGGIESHVFQLSKGLQEHNIAVTVIFIKKYGYHPLCDSLHKENIKVINLDGRFLSLLRLTKKHHPRVFHSHGYKAGIFSRIIGLICNIPVVSTFHMGELAKGRIAIYDWLDRYSAFLAKKTFTVSPQIAQRLPIKTSVFNNFIDIKNLKLSMGNQIAFVGRLSEEKGVKYFLRLASIFTEITFHIYGSGPKEKELKTSAPPNVNFHGQQNDMSLVWHRIELLIMPSLYEGLPMAALEAMARGIPVIASNVGALNTVIDSGKNGWLVKPESTNELLIPLQQWIDMNEYIKQQLKNSARQKIKQHFSAEIAIPKLIKIYQQIEK